MNIKRYGSIAVVALAGAIALAGCSATPAATSTPTPTTPAIDYSSLAGTITAGGSSAQGNAQGAWTAAFVAQATKVTVNYDKSQGSGGGVTNFLAGSYDFAGSDSPLNADSVTKAATTCGPTGAVNLPIYLDGVAVIYNIPGVTSLKLSGATIAKIFNLQITDWSDPAITKDNGTALAAGPIQTVARSDGSGTTQNFTNYLVGTQAANWPYPASNKWPVTGNVSSQQGGSGVVNTVKAGAGTIGYADHSAIGALTAATVDGVTFSATAAAAAFTAGYTVTPNAYPGDLSGKFDYTKLTGGSAYPIPLVSYAILCNVFKDPKQGKLTTSYIGFIASSTGQQVAAKNAGSAPLPQSILDKITASLANIK